MLLEAPILLRKKSDVVVVVGAPFLIFDCGVKRDSNSKKIIWMRYVPSIILLFRDCTKGTRSVEEAFFFLLVVVSMKKKAGGRRKLVVDHPLLVHKLS